MALKQRARMRSLAAKTIVTSLAILVSRLSNIILLVVLTPFLFAGLGERLFGIYQFTQRLSQFGGITNLGATSYLKIRLAELQDDPDVLERRRAVGECLAQWALLTPILLIWVWVVVDLIQQRTGASQYETLGVAALVLITPLAQIAGVGSVALFTHGYGYRSVPVQTAIASAASAGAAGAAYLGAGLLGVAICLFLGTVANSAVSLWTARRVLPWFGVKAPTFQDVRRGLGGSWGASIASLNYLGLAQLESLAFGFGLGPVILARMSLSAIGVQVLDIALRSFLQSTVYALAPLVRERNRERLERLRDEVRNSIVSAVVLTAPAVVGLTDLVVSVWIPSGRTLGPAVTGAILLVAMLRLLSQFDGSLMDQARKFHEKVFASIILVFLPAGALVFAAHKGLGDGYWFWGLPLVLLAYERFVAHRAERLLCLKASWGGLPLAIVLVIASVGAFSVEHDGAPVWRALSVVGVTGLSISALCLHPGCRRAMIAMAGRVNGALQELAGRRNR